MLNETCMLVSLYIGLPPQTKTARSASDDVAVRYRTSRKQARVNKSLFAKKDIGPLTKAAGRARTLFNELTLPYDQGHRIIPADTYFDFTESMSEVSREFDTAKMSFLREYHISLMRAERDLGDLYRESDYPSSTELDGRIVFGIEVNVIPSITSFDKLAGLQPEDIEKLKEQAAAGQQEKVDQALKDLFKRLRKSLDKATIRLAQKDAHFKDSLIGNIEAALVAADNLNLNQNPDLIEMVEDIRETLKGITPNDLRDSEELREKTAVDTEALVKKLDEFF